MVGWTEQNNTACLFVCLYILYGWGMDAWAILSQFVAILGITRQAGGDHSDWLSYTCHQPNIRFGEINNEVANSAEHKHTRTHISKSYSQWSLRIMTSDSYSAVYPLL